MIKASLFLSLHAILRNPKEKRLHSLRLKLLGAGLLVNLLGYSTYVPCVAALSQNVLIQADKQTLQQTQHKGRLEGHVKVTFEGGVLQSNQALIQFKPTGSQNPESMTFTGTPTLTKQVKHATDKTQDKTHHVTGDKMTVFFDTERFLAEGNTVSTLNDSPYLVSDARLVVKANQQQYFAQQHIVTASGQVHVDYKDLQVHSGQAAVYLTPQQKPQRVVFTQGVTMREKDKTLQAQKVTLLPDNKTLSAEGGVVSRMTGAQGSSNGQAIEVRSDHQHFDDTQKTMSASGHVHLTMNGYEARGSKAVYHMNRSTLVLTGRPTIKEASKQVTADKITIQTKPYQTFEAQGNVQTTLIQANKSSQGSLITPSPKPSNTSPKKGKRGNLSSKESPKTASPQKATDILTEEEAFELPE
ncbi:MAG: LptA/OstA family protein [Vampirovibrionales bacterium]